MPFGDNEWLIAGVEQQAGGVPGGLPSQSG